MREITAEEVQKLRGCLQALAAYHNQVSTFFSGSYPGCPHDVTLSAFAKALEENTARIAVVEREGSVVGFCKIDLLGGKGKLDYLVVQEAYRGSGYGKALMDWAMETFARHAVEQIEVKVVAGNEAIHLYEAYGFHLNAHLLVKDL